MNDVFVDSGLCTGCGDCVEQCPTDVFVLKDSKAEPENVKDCMGCMLCETVCPQEAIKVSEL